MKGQYDDLALASHGHGDRRGRAGGVMTRILHTIGRACARHPCARWPRGSSAVVAAVAVSALAGGTLSTR